VEDLRCAALLHDVGMLEVPESILNAPRRLSAEEQKELRGHPAHGAELVRIANFSASVQSAIRSHHERVDGAGYPDGLKADEVPLSSRILSVCDAFVALTSDRPHRAAVSAEEAIAALRASAGSHFDEQVVEDFVHVYQRGSEPEPAAPETVEEPEPAPIGSAFEFGPSAPAPSTA
jgi:HD-GYP domain-containing protein (c-di-GMP phosphodiesterase class II)